MKPFVRTNKRLEKAAKSVKYEIDMLHFTVQNLLKNLLKNEKQKFLEDNTKRAFVESFVVHAYNLYRFFYQGEREWKRNKKTEKMEPRLRKDTDMIVEDYIDNRMLFRKRRAPKRKLKNIEIKRNKQLAHLTYNRIFRNKKTKGWNPELYTLLCQTINAFISALPTNRKKWFE
jgi:hypothetical protein